MKTLVGNFVISDYFPHVNSVLAQSTRDGYRKMWGSYGRYFEQCALELRVCDCQFILRTIASDNPKLNKTSLRHLKNFFSGIWAHALRMGAMDGANPWKSVAIPSAADANETHAYSPAEVELMLSALGHPYDLIVLLAAATGLRKSEIRGLQWGDWNAGTNTLAVSRAVWRSHVKTTKSKASKAPVPVIPQLADRLNAHRLGVSEADRQPDRFIFASKRGGSLDLDNVAQRIIAPAIARRGGIWFGWHSFRRGLATFLHAKGVPDKEIQRILRHSNIAVTQNSYVKVIPENVRTAMANVSFGESA